MRAPTVRALTITVVGALAVKLVILAQLADHPLLSPDSGLDTTAYADLARRLAAGDLLLGPGLYYLSPLYMYVLGLVLAVTDSFTAARVVQVTLGAAAVGGVWWMTSVWWNTRAAWWAAGLMALTGVITFYEVLILQASIDVAATTAILLALTQTERTGTARWTMLSGVAVGLAALNRPNMIVVGAGLLVLLMVQRRITAAGWLLAGLLVAVAPVAIRNGVVAGEWLTVSSHGGLNLYIGNGPGATGFYREIPGIRPSIAGQADDARTVVGERLGRPVTDAEASAYFRNEVLSWARDHPGDAARLFLKKLAFTFHRAYVALPHSYPFFVHDTDAWLRWLPVGPWLLMPLGLVGLAVLARRSDSRGVWVWLAFVPLYAASVAVFFVADRYRLPLLVPMCVGAGIALDAAAQALRARQWRTLLAGTAAAVILFVLVHWPAGLNEGRWVEGVRLAQRFVIMGAHDDAAAWVARLAPDAPAPGLAHVLVGRQYLVEEHPGRALPLLRTAVAAGDTSASTLSDLATAAQRTGATADARDALSRIVISANDPADLWLRLGRLAMSVEAPTLAVPFFAQAVAQTPEDADARLQLGVTLVLQNQISDAREHLRAAVARAPGNPDALAYLAYCEASFGDLAEARRLVDAALRLDPTHRVALSVLAVIK